MQINHEKAPYHNDKIYSREYIFKLKQLKQKKKDKAKQKSQKLTKEG